MKAIQLLFPFAAILFLSSCVDREVQNDYRADYLGDFHFTMISNYSGPNGSGIDTFYYDGQVRAYVNADTAQAFILDDYSIDLIHKIVIELDSAHIAYTVLYFDGTFADRSSTSFSQSGAFDSSKDTLYMTRYIDAPATFDVVTHTIVGVRL